MPREAVAHTSRQERSLRVLPRKGRKDIINVSNVNGPKRWSTITFSRRAVKWVDKIKLYAHLRGKTRNYVSH